MEDISKPILSLQKMNTGVYTGISKRTSKMFSF